MQTIADGISAALKPPGDSVTDIVASEIFQGLTKLAPGTAGAPFKAASAIFQLVTK
jgi:hypothetical protein